MLHNTLRIIILTLLVTGCQTKNMQPIPNLTADLEGSKHRVWKEATYKGIRDELKEGEYIVFKNVIAKLNPTKDGYSYYGDIYSEDGERLFDKKYALSDVGVVKYKGKGISKEIDTNVVSVTRGIRYHGRKSVVDSTSVIYWKTTGGDNPKAIPVRDYKSAVKDRVAETVRYGLYLECFAGYVYATFGSRNDIYAAPGEKITIAVYHPYSEAKLYESEATSYTGVALKIDPYIEELLLKEDAIKLQAFSHANKSSTEVTAYNNGLAEAYSRINGLCQK